MHAHVLQMAVLQIIIEKDEYFIVYIAEKLILPTTCAVWYTEVFFSLFIAQGLEKSLCNATLLLTVHLFKRINVL